MAPPPYDLEALLSRAGWLRRLALKRVGDAALAEDLAQEALVVALRRRPERPAAFLARTLQRLVWRRRRDDAARARREELAARPESLPDSTRLVAQAESLRRLVDEVLALPAVERDAVVLRWFEDLPIREVARRTAVPVATVHSRLGRARRRLREALGEEVQELRSRALFGIPFVRRGAAPLSLLGTSTLAMKLVTLLALASLLPLLVLLIRGEAHGPGPIEPVLGARENAALARPDRHEPTPAVERRAPRTAAANPGVQRSDVQERLIESVRAHARLSVRVLAPGGAPIADATVRCWNRGSTERTRTTDGLGVAVFDELDSGTWNVHAAAPEEPGRFERTGVLAPSLTTRVSLAAGEVRGLDLGGAGGPASVRGLLQLEGAAASGVVLWSTTNEAGGLEVAGFTDLAGAFELELPHPGRWCVLAMTDAGATPLVTAVDVPPEGRNGLVLDVVATVVEIAIHGGPGEVGDVEVRAARIEGSAYIPTNLALTTRTNDAGRARLALPGPGRYLVTADPRDERAPASATVSVTTSAPAAVAFTLRPGREARVVVRAEGEPAEGAALHLFDEAGRALLLETPPTSNANGHASLGRLAPGRYAVAAVGLDGASSLTPFEVPTAGETEVELEVAPGAFLLVRVPDGAGLVGVRDLEGRELGAVGSLATLREDGAWLVGPLAPGVWEVWTTASSGEARVQRLSLGPGERRGVDL